MNSEIIVRGVHNPITEIAASVITECNSCCEMALKIESVSDAAAQDKAVEALKRLKSFIKDAESARKEAKKPLMDAVSSLDERVKLLCEPVIQQVDRISSRIAAFQEQERIKAQKIRDEEDRKRRELLADEQRKQDEINKKMSESNNEMEQERLEFQKEQSERKFREKIVESHSKVAVAAPVKSKGMSVKKSYSFEVTNIHEVYKHNSALIRMEPNTSIIKSLIAQGMMTCPGLKIFEDVSKIGIRT